MRADPDLLRRVGDNPELRMLFMETETILRLHQVREHSLASISLVAAARSLVLLLSSFPATGHSFCLHDHHILLLLLITIRKTLTACFSY